MKFAHGLELNLKSVNKILKIAQDKGYITSTEAVFKCDEFKFDEPSQLFEFHVLNPKHYVTLEMHKFVECYTIFLNN